LGISVNEEILNKHPYIPLGLSTMSPRGSGDV